MAATRFARRNATGITLRFLCNRPFEATVKLAAGQRRARRSDCASQPTSLSFGFGSRIARQLRRRGELHATLTVRVDGQQPARQQLVVTRKRVTVRKPAVNATFAAVEGMWAGDQAWMTCGDIYSGNRNTLKIQFHTTDGSVRWVYWRVWMHTYWDDPAGFIKGWFWKNPVGWHPVASPLYPEASYGRPFRVDGFGIVDFTRDLGGGVRVTEPWTWWEDWKLGYNMYARGVVQLYVWNGAAWQSSVHAVPATVATTDAPGYCWNP